MQESILHFPWDSVTSTSITVRKLCVVRVWSGGLLPPQVNSALCLKIIKCMDGLLRVSFFGLHWSCEHELGEESGPRLFLCAMRKVPRSFV